MCARLPREARVLHSDWDMGTWRFERSGGVGERFEMKRSPSRRAVMHMRPCLESDLVSTTLRGLLA
jgi:hypothetical protein